MIDPGRHDADLRDRFIWLKRLLNESPLTNHIA